MSAPPQPSQPTTPSPAVPTTGRTTVRVRYNQCDPMGVAHHSHYVEWLELGRTELLRESGVSYAQLEDAGVLLAVIQLSIRYKLPARYDDMLTVVTTVAGGGRARIDHTYEILRGDVLLATAATTLGCIGRDGRPRPLPDWLVPSTPTKRVSTDRP
jgi:acyl-CoA thioester hydrolase